MSRTYAYRVRVCGHYLGLIFAERCVLQGHTYKLWVDGLPQVYLHRDQGIDVALELTAGAPVIETVPEELEQSA